MDSRTHATKMKEISEKARKENFKRQLKQDKDFIWEQIHRRANMGCNHTQELVISWSEIEEEQEEIRKMLKEQFEDVGYYVVFRNWEKVAGVCIEWRE